MAEPPYSRYQEYNYLPAKYLGHRNGAQGVVHLLLAMEASFRFATPSPAIVLDSFAKRRMKTHKQEKRADVEHPEQVGSEHVHQLAQVA